MAAAQRFIPGLISPPSPRQLRLHQYPDQNGCDCRLPHLKNRVAPNPYLPVIDSLPAWIHHGCKVTYNHTGEFHKGFIMIGRYGTAHFSCRRQRSSKAESWGVDIPNLVTEWPSLSCENIIHPNWNVSYFLRPPTNAVSASTFISAIHVSARNLKSPCPPSLLKPLHEDFVDLSTWRESYYEENDGLLENDTYVEISRQEYCRLFRLPNGVPKAIPSTCGMTIKRYENMAPARAKSRIVVLENLHNRLWEKSE